MARAFALPLLLALACSSPTATPPATQDGAPPNGEPSNRAGSSADHAVDAKLLDPEAATATAPDNYDVEFETSEGKFVVAVHRKWAPIGADRFYNLVSIGFYDDTAFFRVIEGFMVQFGLSGVPKVNTAWKIARMADDPRTQLNRKGTISFANSGPNSRTTQVFINYNDNTPLDPMGFAPFGEVTQGMDVVMKLHNGYGEGPPQGAGPDQREIERKGNDYLKRRYPEIDWIKRAQIVK